MNNADGESRAASSGPTALALGLLAILSLPLFLLTALFALVGSIWLAIAGEWDVLFGGFILGLLGPIVISLALLLRLPLAALADRGDKVPLLAKTALALSMLYTAGVLTTWCLFVLGNLFAHADSANLVPTLFWAFSSATAPVVFLAMKDSEGQSGPAPASVTMIFCQLGFVLVALFLLFGELEPLEAVGVLGGTILVGQIVVWTLLAPSFAPTPQSAASTAGTSPSVPMSTALIQCGECGRKMRVPVNRGQVKVTCPSCGDEFLYAPTLSG